MPVLQVHVFLNMTTVVQLKSRLTGLDIVRGSIYPEGCFLLRTLLHSYLLLLINALPDADMSLIDQLINTSAKYLVECHT